MTKKQIRSLEKKCLDCSNSLAATLGLLGSAASAILGQKVVADICGGNEIEFRTVGRDGFIDDFECIRIEDVISKCKK